MAAPPACITSVLTDDEHTRLVTEEGERNLWDDILDEQLAKCRTMAFLRQHALDVAPDVVVPASAVLGADSASLRADSAAPVAVAQREDRAPFPSAHPRPVQMEDVSMSAPTRAEDHDVVLAPSLRPSENRSVVAYSSNGAPHDLKKEAQVGLSTEPGPVTSATPPGLNETSSGGADSAALSADSAAPAVVVAEFAAPVAVAQEEDQAPFPSAHPRPPSRKILVQSTPAALGPQGSESRTVGVGCPSKGFGSGYEKEKRSSSRECRPLAVNAPSTTHGDGGVLSRGVSDGKVGRSGSSRCGGGFKGRCAEEERAARVGSGMAVEKTKANDEGMYANPCGV